MCNGHGGIDWAGLPLVVQWLGVRDLDGLIHRLLVIKTHRPDNNSPPPATPATSQQQD